MTIKPQEVLPALLKALPSCREAWKDHLEFWDGEEAGHYNDISVVAHHVVESCLKGEVADLPAFFAEVERLLEHGDQETRTLMAIGLLEDIQIIGSHDDLGYDDYRQWLGVLSRQAWLEVERQWEGVESLADMVRKERSQGE